MLFDQNRVDAIIHNWKNQVFSNETIQGVPQRHSTCLKPPIGGFQNLASSVKQVVSGLSPLSRPTFHFSELSLWRFSKHNIMFLETCVCVCVCVCVCARAVILLTSAGTEDDLCAMTHWKKKKKTAIKISIDSFLLKHFCFYSTNHKSMIIQHIEYCITKIQQNILCCV